MGSDEALALLDQINEKQLLPELIVQLNKDADLSGAKLQIEPTNQLEELIIRLYGFLVQLMTHDFGTYLNFLYRVDIPEHKLREINEIEPKRIAEKVSILVLKREWQKVALRNKIQ